MPGVKGADVKKDGEQSDKRIISRLDFTIQFCWVPTPNDKRLAEDPLKPAGTNDPANPSNGAGLGTGAATAPAAGGDPAAGVVNPAPTK